MSICYDKPRFMKRFLAPVCVLFLLSLSPRQFVYAQTPTITPIPMPSNVRAVDAGTLNELLDNSVPFSIGETEPSVSITIKDVNLTAGKDFKVPKLDTIANFFAGGVRFLTPYNIKRKTIDQEQNLYISGRATYYKTDRNNNPTTINSETAYTTEIIPELSTLDQASRFAAAITSRYSFSPVNGEYNYNVDREPLEIAKTTIEEQSGTGEAQETKTVKTVGDFFENQGGFLELFRSIFGREGRIKAKLASKQLTPYAESMDCLITGCEANGDLSYLKPEEEQKRVKEAGGVVETYAHVDHKITTGNPNGSETNDFDGTQIQTNTLGTKAIENATNYMKCAILPKSVRDKFGVSGKCQQDIVTRPDTTCVTGSLPAFSVKSECKLKSTSINSYTLSPKLVETIEAAASAHDVPASLMLGIMFGEGAFNGNKVFSSAAVDPYLDGCTLLPNCSTSSDVYNNIVPFMSADWSDVADGVKSIDPTRTPNPCNLTDGIFAVAKFIHRFQYSPAFTGKTCFGIPLVSTLTDTAKTCSTWKDTNAETVIRFWEIGGAWNDTTRSCATQVGTCSTGGGGTLSGLQCATGKDTCDRIDKRVAPKSHNGCIWDVYKSH